MNADEIKFYMLEAELNQYFEKGINDNSQTKFNLNTKIIKFNELKEVI